MIVKFNDIEFSDEQTLETVLTTAYNDYYKGAEKQRKINSPKYFIIDFKDANPNDVDFDSVDDETLWDMPYVIFNNKEILLKFMKKLETINEGQLWNWLVDDRIISPELYEKNTYEENFEIMWKLFNPYLPK